MIVTEEEHGLLARLGEESVLELLSGSDDKTFGIGSSTDDGQKAFANKKITKMGDEVIPAELGIGYTCRKGLKPQSPNQDSWIVMRMDDCFSLYAVFDGHGKQGHFVSNYVKECIPRLIIRDQRFKTNDMRQMLIDVFKKMQTILITADREEKIYAQKSGTTATVCIHDHIQRKLHLAHVADSTAVLVSGSGENSTARALTRNHKPQLEDEKRRIEKSGGKVVFDGYANHRVYVKDERQPGLNMSRCLGDIFAHEKCGVSCEPEVLELNLKDDDNILLLCSDGVWEFMTPQQSADILKAYTSEKAMPATDHLVTEAWGRWIKAENGVVVDDITALVVFLNPQHAQS